MPYPSKTDRGTILAAAVQQLEEQGLRGLSLRSLAASLELAPNALYRYFADRSALEGALADQASKLLHEAMQRAVRRESGEGAIRAIARAYLAFARKRPNLYKLLLLPCEHAGEEDAHNELWGFVVEQVAVVTSAERANEVSVALWAFLHGMAELEAAKVFGDSKPGSGFEFGLDALLVAAAKTCS